MKYTLLVLCIIICSLTCNVRAQTDNYTKTRRTITRTIVAHEIQITDTVSKYNDVVYNLVGDTLFTNKNFKIFIGKKFIVGRGSLLNGWFKTISLNSIIDWYSITLGVLGTTNTETPEQREMRTNNLVKDCLRAEGTLYVRKIKKIESNQPDNRYVLVLGSRPGVPNTNYRCYIQTALKTGEIILTDN